MYTNLILNLLLLLNCMPFGDKHYRISLLWKWWHVWYKKPCIAGCTVCSWRMWVCWRM